MVSMGKPYSRYRSFNDAVSLTIFICIDRKVMIELRDLFYDIEKHYFNMLDIGESFLECLDKEQERIKLLETEKKYKIIQKNL